MRYLVTGVAGFIGSHIAEALLTRAEVVGVDCFTSSYSREVKESNLRELERKPGFRFVEMNLCTVDSQDLLAETDTVIHAAGQPGVRPSWGTDFAEYVQNNVVAVQRLLEAARRTKLRRFVYASSSSIYGNAKSYPTSEEVLPQPFSPYGVTKLAGEHLCSSYAANWGVPTVALRYFTVYGPRQRPDMAFHRFIEAALHRQKLRVYGTGEQLRDFTYVEDVARASFLASQTDLPPGTVLNVAGGCHATINDVLEILSELLKRPLRVTRTDAQAGDVAETKANCDRAERLLGWRPTIGLAQGLAIQLDWHRQRTSAGLSRGDPSRRIRDAERPHPKTAAGAGARP
jgi:UDP-glucuronate 4-epimerase